MIFERFFVKRCTFFLFYLLLNLLVNLLLDLPLLLILMLKKVLLLPIVDILPSHVVWVWKLSKLKIYICIITYFVQ